MRECAALVASAVPYAGVVRSRTPSGAGIQLSWTAPQGMLRPLRHLIYCRDGRLVDVLAEYHAIAVVVQLGQSSFLNVVGHILHIYELSNGRQVVKSSSKRKYIYIYISM